MDNDRFLTLTDRWCVYTFSAMDQSDVKIDLRPPPLSASLTLKY